MIILKLLKDKLLEIVDDIDKGNTNCTEEELEELLLSLTQITSSKVSKYQAMKLLNCSRSTFDDLVLKGELPKGRRQQGFKEIFWLKSDILKYIEKKKKLYS